MPSKLKTVALLGGLIEGAVAQKIGSMKEEQHPSMTISKCTKAGCVGEASQVVIDANWRWVHAADAAVQRRLSL